MKNYKYNNYPCNGCLLDYLCGNSDSCSKLEIYYREREHGMDKNQIIEAAFETIRESTEWGIGDKSDRYVHFVDGVVTMADALLNKINEEKNRKPDEN